jgi:CRP-like cAMP-binding protein
MLSRASRELQHFYGSSGSIARGVLSITIAKRVGMTRETTSRITSRWIRMDILGWVEERLVTLKPER